MYHQTSSPQIFEEIYIGKTAISANSLTSKPFLKEENLKKNFLKKINFFLGNRQIFLHKNENFVKNHNYQ